MGSTPHRNLRVFAELTGPDSAKNVVLATTMWDILGPMMDDVGEKREQRLKTEYWNIMIDHGAAVRRFLNDPNSAWNIINDFLDGNNENGRTTTLIFQEERVDHKIPLKDTSAGKALSLDLKELIRRQEETKGPSATQSNSSRRALRGGKKSA